MPGRNPSAIGTETTGEIDWVDLQNNWRAVDAEWLQERSIVRVSTAAPGDETNLISGTIADGRVFYSTNSKKLVVRANSTNKAVLASDSLMLTDGTSTVTLSVPTGSAPATLTFTKSTGAIGVDTLSVTTLSATTATITTLSPTNLTVTNLTATAASGTLKSTSSGVEIETTGTAGNKVTLTTAASAAGLVSDKGFSVTAGGITVTAGGLTVTAGGISVASGTTAVQALTATSAAVTTATASTSVTTPLVQSGSGADLTLTAASGQALRVTNANFYYGASGTGTKNAWVVYGADPGVSTVPEGTIWIS